MAIRMPQVKQLCTASEVELVEASRKPRLEQLILAEARRHAQRARKLFDKWQDQARRQARSRERQVGFGDADSRSHQKEQIFAEALASFEAHIAKLERAADKGRGKAKVAATPKKARTAGHRESRASVRADLSEAKAELNAKKAKPKKKTADKSRPTSAAKTTAAKNAGKKAPVAVADPADDATESTSRIKDPAVSPPSKKRKRPPAPPAGLAQKKFAGAESKQIAVGAKAKKTIVKLSGRTTRMFGHTASRGKRAQARRDQRG